MDANTPTLAAELEQARETNKRLNRRAQEAEKVRASVEELRSLTDGSRPVSNGLKSRLVGAAWSKQQDEIESLNADLAASKARAERLRGQLEHLLACIEGGGQISRGTIRETREALAETGVKS